MLKQTILFIQGGGKGAYEEDRKLVMFLKHALGEMYEINYPRMPNEDSPDYENYKHKIEEELKKTDGKLILVGHSLGSCFLLKYLSEEKTDNDIAGIFLIATPYWGDGGWQYEGFSLRNDFAASLPDNTPIYFYHGTNDEIVPFTHLALYAIKLPHAVTCKLSGRGHQLNNDLSEVVHDIKNSGV